MKLNANLEGGQLSGRLSDRDEALRLLLLISGTLTERKQEVRLTGNVFDFDLAELGISPQKIGRVVCAGGRGVRLGRRAAIRPG